MESLSISRKKLYSIGKFQQICDFLFSAFAETELFKNMLLDREKDRRDILTDLINRNIKI